ncbi:MAG: pantoate--beta-alanine ligase [Flavobacteriaceae bacterium]
MRVLNTIDAIRSEIRARKSTGTIVGLVPTMGALHQGHLEIVKRAVAENETVIVSIFVNPMQFNDNTDLEKYPRDLQTDLSLLSRISSNILVFAPDVKEVYSDGLVSGHYKFDGLDQIMEGRFRPGHFHGVATVVEKLLNIVRPHVAYFGKKDYQQLLIIKSLVKQRKIPVKIIGCSIVREASGLALSSRNERLTKRLRKEASFIYGSLKAAKVQFGTKSAISVVKWVEDQFTDHADLELEYIVIADELNLRPVVRKVKGKRYRAFIAVYAEGIRLIDNVALN